MVTALLLAVALAQTPQTPQTPQSPQATPQTPQTPQAPQAPQAPPAAAPPGSNSQQSTTVVVPPPPGQAPVVVAPQERPVTVAPCPEPRVVYRDRNRRNPMATVLVDAFLGSAAGLAFGAAVGLADGDDTWKEWRQDLGWGAVIGFGAGAVTGGVLAYLDRQQEERAPVAALRPLTNRPLTSVVTLRGRF